MIQRIQLINRTTGGSMWVANSRLNEYLERGHTLAPAPDGKPEKATPEEFAQLKKRTRKKQG